MKGSTACGYCFKFSSIVAVRAYTTIPCLEEVDERSDPSVIPTFRVNSWKCLQCLRDMISESCCLADMRKWFLYYFAIINDMERWCWLILWLMDALSKKWKVYSPVQNEVNWHPGVILENGVAAILLDVSISTTVSYSFVFLYPGPLYSLFVHRRFALTSDF